MTKSEREQYRKVIEESEGLCHICHKQGECVHHVFGGANRDKSTKYGLMVYLCAQCHEDVHKYRYLSAGLKREAHAKFDAEHPELDFFEIFKRNY